MQTPVRMLMVAACVGVIGATPRAQAPAGRPAAEGVSRAAIQESLAALDVDRTSGGDGERQAYDYLEKKLREYGVRYTRYSPRLFLSWPGKAELTVEGGQPVKIAGESGVFAAPTPPAGVAARPIFDPPFTRRADRVIVFGAEVRGRLVVVPGALASENVVLAAQAAGAAGVVQVDEEDTLHEETVMSVWGAPTTESARRLPAIPYICIRKSDGDRLRAASNGGAAVRLVTEMKQGWRNVPMIVADVPGRSPDFVLVTTHLDAWYRGMHDTAGTVATILEMARVFQARRDTLARGIRFAWWTGHSFGRYAGSAWYVDRAYADLDEHCVAHMNLDMVGARGSQMDAVAAGGWPGLADYAREVGARVSGKAVPPGRRGGGVNFRPGRDSDSSFQGLGIPLVYVELPGPPANHPDMEPGGRYRYWHTPQDTMDKVDPAALERDTMYRVGLLQDLAGKPVLPHRLAPVAASYRAAVDDLSAAAKDAFDLASTKALVARLGQAADRVDALPAPADPAAIARLNAVRVRSSRRLYSTLYTKAGRFDQDPASEMPVLPLLARVRDLAAMSPTSDEFGFLETELYRGKNAVEATLREVIADLEASAR